MTDTVKQKPVVKYRPHMFDCITVGGRADVYALDHPRLGQQWVITSTVLEYDKASGKFETLNTMYEPEPH